MNEQEAKEQKQPDQILLKPISFSDDEFEKLLAAAKAFLDAKAVAK